MLDISTVIFVYYSVLWYSLLLESQMIIDHLCLLGTWVSVLCAFVCAYVVNRRMLLYLCHIYCVSDNSQYVS